MTTAPEVPPVHNARTQSRIELALGHIKAVLGDTPIAALVRRELETARDFSFAGQSNGVAARTAEQVIRLQEAQFRLPENGSE